jgi:hypothetical protein
MLVSEALHAGFSLEQIKHADAELDSPPQPSTQVGTNLKQGSISKQIVDVWIANRKGKVKHHGLFHYHPLEGRRCVRWVRCLPRQSMYNVHRRQIMVA